MIYSEHGQEVALRPLLKSTRILFTIDNWDFVLPASVLMKFQKNSKPLTRVLC